MSYAFSVVVPTYNRLDRLRQVLAALDRQSYSADNYEVVVVSDGSTDGTNHYLASLTLAPTLTPIFQENQGVAVARNRGLAEARGEHILFLDDDVVPAPGLLHEHARTHEAERGEVVVLAPMLTPADHELLPWVSWEQEMLYKQYQAMIEGEWEATARQFYTGNTSLPRHHLLAAGGFDPAFRRAEDVELAYRLRDQGLRFVFNPEAVGLHYAERSYDSWYETPYLYGRNDVIFAREKEQAWLLSAVFYEFHGRHPFIRGLTNLCLDHPTLTGICTRIFRQAGTLLYRRGAEEMSRMAFSAIFNLRHYQGVADGLGGREAFYAGVRRHRPKPGWEPDFPPEEPAPGDHSNRRQHV